MVPETRIVIAVCCYVNFITRWVGRAPCRQKHPARFLAIPEWDWGLLEIDICWQFDVPRNCEIDESSPNSI